MKPLKGYEKYNVCNWDGYGGDPITPETVTLASRIFDMIDERAADAPGGDGSICLEWRDGDDILCLDIGPGKKVSFYGRIEGEHINSKRGEK